MDNNEKKPSRSAVIKNTIYAAKVITKASPFLLIGYTLSITGYWFFESYVKNVIFLEKMINTVTEGGTFRQFMLILLAFCGFGLLAHFLDCFGDFIASAENKKVYRMLNEQIFRKACQVDIECYENPKFYDNYKRATDVINNELSAEFSWTTGKFISSAITAVGLVSYICSVDPIILIFLTGMIPYIASQSFRNKLEYKKDREMTSNNRKKDYVQRVVFLKDFSKEFVHLDLYLFSYLLISIKIIFHQTGYFSFCKRQLFLFRHNIPP